MKRFGIALLLAFVMVQSAFGADRVLSSYLVEESALRAAPYLTFFEVERRVGDKLEVLVPATRAKDLLAVFPKAQLVEKDINDVFKRMDRSEPNWRAGYHNWTSVQAELKQLTQDYPMLAALENYGKSDDGEPLLAIRLTSPTMVEKPEVLITSSTHGNEIATVEITMGAINEILKGYGKETKFTEMLDNHVVYFIPVVSPDGYKNRSREVHGVDPNRNFPWPSSPNKQSIPTIANWRKWAESKKIVGSIDIHAPAEMVMYPWAYTGSAPQGADLVKFKEVGNIMGKDLGFPVGQIYHIIYPAPGSSADYWYWKHGTLAYGLEIGGGSFAPSSSQLPTIIAHHLPALYHFIEAF